MVPFEPFRIPLQLLMFLGQFKGARLFKLHKLMTAFRVKKGTSVLRGLTKKKLVPGFPLGRSPCTHKPPAASASVPTGSLLRQRYYTILFFSS